MQNKKIMWMLVFLVIAAKASAIGIGAPNVALYPEGKKTLDLYVINDEHKDMEVRISVQGELEKDIKLSNDVLPLSASEELKKFSVTINFPEKVESETRITVSETGSSAGQITAVAYASYKLKIAGKESKKEEPKFTESVKERESSAEEFEKGQYIENIPEQPAKKQIEKLSAEEKKTGLKEIIYRPVPLTLILAVILTIVATFDVIFLEIGKKRRNKNPLEDFIREERKIGVSEEEIRNKLIGAGWAEEEVNNALKNEKT